MPQRTRGFPIVATVVATLYLLFITPIITDCAASSGFLHWLPAILFTLPTSLAVEYIMSLTDTAAKFFVYAFVNACLLFVLCEGIIQLGAGMWTSRRRTAE